MFNALKLRKHIYPSVLPLPLYVKPGKMLNALLHTFRERQTHCKKCFGCTLDI
jgi:hypothetical protein